MRQSTVKHDVSEDNRWYHNEKIAKDDLQDVESTTHPRKWDINWRDVAILFVVHIAGIYGAYLLFLKAKWQTRLYIFLLYFATGWGVTAGAHRLWAHKSFKATLPLRIILLTMFTMSVQFSLIQWVRHHRMHHKYCDTDADPHNSTRGFFYSHIGWLLLRKHPEVRARSVDLSDLYEDPLLRFQHNYYSLLAVIFAFMVPAYFTALWGEEVYIGFYVVCFRLMCNLHATWLVNSAAHMWGTRPYDKDIRPVECKTVSLVAGGEGFHNFHHTFPWDYRTAELGGYSLNLTKLLIDMMATIGWAYDLKTVSDELIQKRVKRTGDGTHPVLGWDDPDTPLREKTKKSPQ